MKTKTGKLFIIYPAAAVLIASVVRFFQYVSVIDYRTGFFLKGSEAAGNLIYIILAVLLVGFLGLIILGAKRKWTAVTVSSSGMGSKATIFLGISYLLSAVIKVYELFSAEGYSFFKTLALSASLIFFAALGLMLMKSTVPPAFTGFFLVIPCLMCFFLAVELFMSDLVIKNHSDSLILLFVFVFGTLFFANSARFYGRLEAKISRPKEIFMAGAAFIFSGVHVVSKLIALLFGGNTVSDMAHLGMDKISPDALVIMLISGVFLGVTAFTEQTAEIEYLPEEKDEKKEKKAARQSDN